MSVVNGQPGDENTFNNAFASKQDDNTLIGVQRLENTGSGGNIANVQQKVNDNSNNITTNTTDIATNTANIATNTSDISDRTTDISDLVALSGEAVNSVEHSGFTGSTFSDGTTKEVLQEAELALEARILLTEKGAANGVASLDGSGLVPVAQLPSSIVGSLNYQGTWNASTNTPSLASGVGTKGYYYVIATAGSTSLDGISDWQLGDWAVYNGSAWEKIDNSDSVTSVNGQTGTVVLDTDDVAEAANLYYSEARVTANTSVTANTAKVSASGSINTHSDVDTTSVAPVLDDVLVWDGSNWVPGEGGSGSGVGGINYITNHDAEVDTTGWVTYADSAGVIPVDGTGGSPTVTFTRTTSSPLRGTGSFLITKDAANRQGQGASYDFTIDSADKAKVLSIEFDYIVDSGTFVAGTNSANSDLIVYIYDVTNSRLISPSSVKLFSASSTVADKYQASFQSSSDSVSYRLIFHVSSTSALAYAVKAENVLVGPSKYIFGTPVTDWASYTPATTGWGTPSSVAFRYRRVGDSIQVVGSFISGTTTAVAVTFSLPSGLTFNSAKQNVTTLCGHLSQGNSSATLFHYSVMTPSAGGSGVMQIGVQTSSTTQNNATSGLSFGSSSLIQVKCELPVTGWSSSVQMSDSADTRVVALNVTKNSGNHTINGNWQKVSSWQTPTLDTHSGFNSSTGDYTIPVSGAYQISGAVGITFGNSATTMGSSISVDGSRVSPGSLGPVGALSTGISSFGTVLNLRAGQVVSVEAIQNESASEPYNTTAGALTNFSIARISGPTAIAANETIAFSANTSTTVVTAFVTPINFTNVLSNTHGAYSAGTFTVPAPGFYLMNGQTYTASTHTVFVYVNGTQSAEGTPLASASQGSQVTLMRYLNSGDTVQIRIDQSQTITGGAVINRFSAIRLGI